MVLVVVDVKHEVNHKKSLGEFALWDRLGWSPGLSTLKAVVGDLIM